MTDAIRDNNHRPVALGVSSTDSTVTLPLKVDPATGRLLTDAAGGYTNLTQFVDQTAWRIFYSDGSGDVQELALGASGTVLTSGGATSAPTWAASTGDVTAAAVLGDNLLIRGDGAVKGVQNSGITVDDTDNLSGVGNITGVAAGITLSTATNGNITIDPGGSGVATVNAGSGGVAITTDAGNANITLTPHGTGDVIISSGTASEIAIFDASKGLQGAAVATYPSLTELTYVKGVTSAIQTQLNAKQATITFGTGVETALGVNVGSAGAFVTFDGALGTPSSGTVTNLTGTASININGTVGATTPTTGAFTTLSSSSTLTASTTIELGNASDTTLSRSAAGVMAVEGVVIPSISSTNTLTNKRITKRVGSTTSSATPTINTDDVDAYHLTAQAADITSFTTNLSGTPTDFQQLRISVTGTAARAITWGASFANGSVALPTTTVTTTRLDVLFEYDTVTSKWRCMASGSTV